MSTEVYLVKERAYEYNDEVYQSSDNGYNPLVLYKSKELAQKVAFEKNLNFIMSDDLGAYGYDVDEIVNDERLINLFPDTEEFLAAATYDVDWKGLAEFITQLPTNDQIKAINCFIVKPFTVQSIMIEDD